MTHSWGDSWPHWNELYQAEIYIGNYVYKWSRCRLQSKEKWGTLRYEHIWPPVVGYNGPVITLPKIFDKTIVIGGKPYKLSRYLINWTNSWLYYKWMKLGDYVLRIAVKKACIKFPNVVEEITCELNWD